MSRRHLPQISKAALRDYGGSEQSAAVWRRLKVELRAPAPLERRSAFVWVWAPALACVLFGSGVVVGARFIRPQALSFVQAEPRSQLAPAAGPMTAKASLEPEPGPGVPQPKAASSRGHRQLSSVASSSEPFNLRPAEPSAHVTATATPIAEWQRLVEAGDFAAARRALDGQGGFDVAMAHASPSELMSLVDIARASGDRGQAISALRQVLAHPDAPEASLAAWTLGNLLQQAGDQPGAAQAFTLYRRLSPAGDFAEDAAARQVDVALAEGNAELVTQLVADYARDFPQGRRLTEFRRAEHALLHRDHEEAPKPDPAHEEPEDESDEPHVVPSAAAPAASDRH